MEDYEQTIEKKMIEYVNHQTKPFTRGEALEAISRKTGIDEELVDAELEYLLDGSELFFEEPEGELFIARRAFFQDARFSIVPSEAEIRDGIIIPGHRFIPFINPLLFPSELTLTDVEDDSYRFRMREFRAKFEDLAASHIMLGSEEMLHFLMAEHQQNAEIITHGEVQRKLILSVFDFGDYYKTYSCKPGDALVMQVKDWLRGVYTVDFLPGEMRNDVDMTAKEWINVFEDNLLKVIDRFGEYITVPEQCAQTYYLSGRKLLDNPVISLEEYRERTEVIEIMLIGTHTMLNRIPDDREDDDFPEIPDDVMISQGKTESLDAILTELKIPVKRIELEAYMNHELFEGGESLDAVMVRCFGNVPFVFVDEGQEVIFQNYVEELWESVNETYNRFIDKNRGELREHILGVTDKRLQWLRYLADEQVDTEKLPKQPFGRIAECSVRLEEMLRIINESDQDFADLDMPELLEAVEDIADYQGELISEINKQIL